MTGCKIVCIHYYKTGYPQIFISSLSPYQDFFRFLFLSPQHLPMRPPSHVGRLQLRPPPPFRDSFRDPAPADVTPPVSPFQLPPPPQRLGALAILRKWTFTIFCASLTLPKKLQLGRRKSNCDNAISQSDDSHGNEDEELAVIVEGVTHSMPPDILLASGIVLQVENKASDEFPSSRGNDALNSSSETDHEDADSILSSSDESMSEAAIAEIEAGIYGLQIIKDADLEEVQELGSGTFCSTVMAVVTYLVGLHYGHIILHFKEKTFSYVSLLAGSPRPNASLDYTFFLSNCIGHWPGLFRGAKKEFILISSFVGPVFILFLRQAYFLLTTPNDAICGDLPRCEKGWGIGFQTIIGSLETSQQKWLL
uniref:Uncharacterized protein n=1 Tax=Cucumis melo TaxID=3656 RepID=A0A9I9E6S3_CUCME